MANRHAQNCGCYTVDSYLGRRELRQLLQAHRESVIVATGSEHRSPAILNMAFEEMYYPSG
jgi:CO dehydrogenase nickel-insertion accessory protein CooC1